MTEPLEPAERLIDEPTDDQGRPLGWRGADITGEAVSNDDYAAQFTRHDSED